MNNEFKEAYETINISSDVKNRIKGEIMNENKTTRKVFHFGKPFAVAAVIVALVVPRGVFATQQMIKHYKMKMMKGSVRTVWQFTTWKGRSSAAGQDGPPARRRPI